MRHPGKILMEDWLKPHNITRYRLVHDTDLQVNTVYRLCREEGGITPRTAKVLGKYFDNSPEYWLGLQMKYSLTK